MIWIIETIGLIIGVFILINGWIIPFIGFTFIGVCLIAEVYASIQRIKLEKREKLGTEKDNVI